MQMMEVLSNQQKWVKGKNLQLLMHEIELKYILVLTSDVLDAVKQCIFLR